MPRAVYALALLLPIASPAQAQAGLRSEIPKLFSFGNCGSPLCLDGSVSAANGHGDHFIPATAAGNSAVISFINEAIGKSVANTPISAASSGATFAIVGGLPVKTSTSAGPVFGERPQTLGRGRFFLGANVTGLHFSTLNGVPVDKLKLNFVHQDVGTAGLGDPGFENDVIEVGLGLDINLLVSSLFLTAGLTDFIDIGVAVPFVRTRLHGTSEAQIVPFGPIAPHFFGGDAANPILRAASVIDGSATGIGDIAARVKINLGQGRTAGAALLGDIRFATGDEEDLLGAGATSVRGLAIVAAQFGSFSPHLNGGYLARTGALQNDAILATIGFDQLMTPWATLAVDLVSEWQVGDSKIALPGTVVFSQPFVRRVDATSIPQRDENVLNASIGMKFSVRGGTTIVVNGITPLRKVGLQPDFVWTGGLEYSF